MFVFMLDLTFYPYLSIWCVLISIQFKWFFDVLLLKFVFYFRYIWTDITRILTIYYYFMGYRMYYKLEPNPKCYYPNPTRTYEILECDLGRWTRKPKNPNYMIRTRTYTQIPIFNNDLHNLISEILHGQLDDKHWSLKPTNEPVANKKKRTLVSEENDCVKKEIPAKSTTTVTMLTLFFTCMYCWV